MRVHIAADHAGFELKRHLTGWLRDHGHDVADHGADAFDPDDDYPPYCIAAAEAVVAEPGSLGIVLGGSGNGEQIAANKVAGTRTVLAWSLETAALGRQHNDANVIAIGARMHDVTEASAMVERFLTTRFSGDERHRRRIEMLASYERTGEPPGVAEAG